MFDRIRSLLGRLARENDGVSVLETAIVAPILLLLVSGAVDAAMGFSLKLSTQQAAARSIELATTGGLEATSTSELRQEAATAAGVSENDVAVDMWLECNGTRQSDFDAGCGEGEEAARYVSVRIDNSYRPMLGALLPSSMTRDGGVIPFFGFSTVRLQ